MQRYIQGRPANSRFSFLSGLFGSFKHSNKKNLLKNGILGASAGILLTVIVAGGLFAWYAKDLPNPNAILERDIPQSTKIYDKTGTHLLYEIALEEKRTLVTLDQIPDYVKNATISAEDRDFYHHNGFSFTGFGRSIYRYLLSFGRVKQGGSTITQQLVKNAILTNEKHLSRKVKELILSLAIEQIYTKEQILQMYLNEIPYGSTNYGVESAARAYFDKQAKDLTLGEAATLAALPQLPTVYLNDPERLKARRDWILEGMVTEGYISREDADAALATDTPVSINIGRIEAPHFVMYVKSLLEEEYGARLVETGGLTVITSLDYDKQLMAEQAITDGIAARGTRYGFTSAGLVSLDPRTGQIISMVGSPDYYAEEQDGQVNVTLQPLQPGSSIKPIVYAAAFEKGYTPNTLLWDTATKFPTATGDYEPKNYNGRDNGIVTMRKALQGSLNIAAVKTLYLVGIDNAVKFMQRLGYSNEYQPDNIGLSMVLGGIQVTPLEHTGAFATFANNGIYHKPVAILKIQEPNGTVLKEWKADEEKGEQVIDANLAATMSNVLSDNGARAFIFGSNNSLVLPGGRPAAAKTGTTNEYKDAWTMGYTPSLATGIWVGNADGTKMKGGADGSVVAGPIWNQYMRNALNGTAVETFPEAKIPVTGKRVLDGKIPGTAITFDTASGKLATDRTPDRYRKEVVCGEYHDILYYVDRTNPLGDQPEHPEKDPQYKAWETSVDNYLTRHNANLPEGQKPLVRCSAPDSEDDVHTEKNSPVVAIREPDRNENVGRTFEVRLDTELKREFSRVEYLIDGSYVASGSNPEGGTITLPGWVGKGSHTLTATVYDDVDNSGSDTVKIDVEDVGSTGSFRITNPFNGQTIEKSAATYSVAVEVPNAEELISLSVIARNLWTGEQTTISTTNSPSPITSATWTIPNEGDYILEAQGTTRDGTVEETTPIKVLVRNPKSSGEITVDEAATEPLPDVAGATTP
jgi:1A family penicillin-binding protein